MNILSTVLLGGALFGLLYTALSWLVLVISIRKRRVHSSPAFAPPVTVFKPLKGLDENLEHNLECFFRQEYPQYELIFGLNDDRDPAIEVVKKLVAAYPQIRCKLVIDTRQAGYNPKVNNLCNMAPHASYDYWVISDSNVRVDDHYLSHLVECMRDQRVGLATSVIRGVGAKSIGAKLENLHLNSFIAAGVVAISRLSGIPVSIGKSMLLRRETIMRSGGFEAFADYLLEDGLIGRGVRKLGLQAATCTYVVENVNELWTVRDFLSRHYRWALMRRHLNVRHYSGEILSNPIFLALLAAAVSPSITTALLCLSICVVKMTFDAAIIRAVGGSTPCSSVLLLPLKDLLIGLVWLRPFISNQVSWRGHRFRIGAMTKITPVLESSGFSSHRTGAMLNAFARKYRLTRQRLSAWGSRA